MLYYLRKTWKDSTATIICQIISYGVEALAAIATMEMFEGLLALDTVRFAYGLAAHLGAWAVSFMASHLETVFHYRAQRQINKLVRMDMAEQLLHQCYSDYHKTETGTYLSSFTNDVNQMEKLGWEPLFNLFGQLAAVISCLVALYSLHWSLLVASLVLSAIMVYLPGLFDSKLNAAGETCSVLQATAVSRLKDLLSGYDVLCAFHRTQELTDGVRKANGEMETPRYKMLVLQSLIGNASGFFSVVCQVGIRLLAGLLILMGQLSVSVMASVNTLCATVYNGVKTIVNLRVSLASAKPYFDKITVHANTAAAKALPAAMPTMSEGINVKSLSFNYGDKPVLRKADLTFEKGKKYAITGPSGCGKSTLLKLLLGWLPDYTGSILIDGKDARDYTTEQLQGQMSYIEQNVFLFNTTIRENITLGEDFSDEAMQKALHDSALAGDLANMPEGLDTVVGEDGSRLSGGQKQRVAIARALIHGRSTLLVDEGTSALDKRNADIVETSLLQNPDLTLLLVSHHLTDERRAQFDEVYELKQVTTV